MQCVNSREKNNKLREAIIKTIVFFDLFDFPLTEFELWKYINVKCDLNDIQAVLNKKKSHDFIEEKNGFYFLAGRREIIKTREERRNYAERKIKKAARVSKLFKLIPWIKMVAVGNMIGENNLKDESDIDFFIIVEPERIWLVRFFCAAAAQLLGQRPKKNNTRDKICLSFFASEEAMDLEGLMLDGKDIYFIYWLAGLRPIYNKAGTYEKFTEANDWLKNYLPNWRVEKDNKSNLPPDKLFKHCRDIFNPLCRWLEQEVKKFQLRLLPDNLKKAMNKDTRVVINDKILKLHVNDRREEYREAFFRKIQEIC